MKLLYFKNPVFHTGLHVTVRNGKKWFDAQPGEKLALVDTESQEVVGEVTVLHAVHLPFDSIPDYWLQFEHDPSCRDLAGLRKEMDRVYEGQWGEDVTVVFFMKE